MEAKDVVLPPCIEIWGKHFPLPHGLFHPCCIGLRLVFSNFFFVSVRLTIPAAFVATLSLIYQKSERVGQIGVSFGRVKAKSFHLHGASATDPIKGGSTPGQRSHNPICSLSALAKFSRNNPFLKSWIRPCCRDVIIVIIIV